VAATTKKPANVRIVRQRKAAITQCKTLNYVQPRLVCAERIFGESIPACFERPGAGSAAEHMILAGAAAPFKLCRVVQRSKGGRMAINIRQAVPPDVADYEGQKARGQISPVCETKTMPWPSDSKAAVRGAVLNLLGILACARICSSATRR